MITLTGKTLGEMFKEYANQVLRDGFVVDAENKEQLNEAIRLFTKGQTGITIMGNPGSGKTIFFEIMQQILNPRDFRQFKIKNVLDIVLEFNTEGHQVFKKYQHDNILFDDLGTEGQGNWYQDKVNVMAKFIEMRYAHYRKHKSITHFTTNLSGPELMSRYGLRVDSRLKEISTVIKLGGVVGATDRRTYKNFINYIPVNHIKILTKQEAEDIKENRIIEEHYAKIKQELKDNPPENKPPGLGSQLRKLIG